MTFNDPTRKFFLMKLFGENREPLCLRPPDEYENHNIRAALRAVSMMDFIPTAIVGKNITSYSFFLPDGIDEMSHRVNNGGFVW